MKTANTGSDTMQAYSLCSALLMAQQRRIECETYKRQGDIDSALLALESCYYWQNLHSHG